MYYGWFYDFCQFYIYGLGLCIRFGSMYLGRLNVIGLVWCIRGCFFGLLLDVHDLVLRVLRLASVWLNGFWFGSSYLGWLCIYGLVLCIRFCSTFFVWFYVFGLVLRFWFGSTHLVWIYVFGLVLCIWFGSVLSLVWFGLIS